MRIYKTCVFLGLIIFSCNQVMADNQQIPPVFKAIYKLYTSGLEIGETERVISKLSDNEYNYRSESRSTGIVALFYNDHIIENSRWKFIDNKFIPINYSYVRYRGEKDREVNIQFDWENQLLLNQVNEKKYELPLAEGILDQLSYQYALMHDLYNGQVPEKYSVADGRKIKIYIFEKLGEENVTTPLGVLETVKLLRTRENDVSKLVLWCAPKYGYLPVKIEKTEDDGRLIKAVIQNIDGL
jgi:hypothetical protein